MWNFQSCPLSPHRRNSSREKTKSGALNSTAPERPNNNNNTPAGAGQSPRATNKRPLGCRRQWSAGQTGPHGADAQASVKYDWSPRHGAARHGTARHATPRHSLPSFPRLIGSPWRDRKSALRGHAGHAVNR